MDEIDVHAATPIDLSRESFTQDELDVIRKTFAAAAGGSLRITKDDAEEAFYTLSLPGWAGARPPTQAFANAYRATARSPDRNIDQTQFVKMCELAYGMQAPRIGVIKKLRLKLSRQASDHAPLLARMRSTSSSALVSVGEFFGVAGDAEREMRSYRSKSRLPVADDAGQAPAPGLAGGAAPKPKPRVHMAADLLGDVDADFFDMLQSARVPDDKSAHILQRLGDGLPRQRSVVRQGGEALYAGNPHGLDACGYHDQWLGGASAHKADASPADSLLPVAHLNQWQSMTSNESSASLCDRDAILSYATEDWFGLEYTNPKSETHKVRTSAGHGKRLRATMTKHRGLIMPEISADRPRQKLHVKCHRELRYALPERERETQYNTRGQKLKRLDTLTQLKLDSMKQYRPIFTILSLVVMYALLIAEIVKNGKFQPIGVGVNTTTVNVTFFGNKSVAQEVVTPKNMWAGPSTATLIRMGAKFAPCMREDRGVKAALGIQNTTFTSYVYGCCELQDGTCMQTPKAQCTRRNYPAYRRWSSATPCHARNCTVVARPCCLGVYGKCAVIGEDHCRTLNGQWVAAKETCQGYTNCLNEVCGGLSDPARPNQGIRFVAPIFLHVGVFHLLLNTAMHLGIGIPLERTMGWLRMAIIFMLSGIGGNLVSAVFNPYAPQVGSSGALYGLLAVLLVELFQNWPMLAHPWLEALKLVVTILVSLLIGTLPWIDNFAHLGGFIFGLVAAVVFLPYITFGKWDRRRKRLLLVIGFLLLCVLFGLLFGAFYLQKNNFCPWCHYFDCIPWSKDFCQVELNTWDGTL